MSEREMEYRYLGRTGVRVSPLCLGTMLFGGRTEPEDSYRIIDRALDAGINFLDTANVYLNGRSEEVVGESLKRNGHRDWIVLATKCHGNMHKDPGEDGDPTQRLLPAMIERAELRSTIDVARETCAATYATVALEQAGRSVFESGLTSMDALGPKDSERWQHAEHAAVTQALIPIAFHLLSMSVRDRESVATAAREVVCGCQDAAEVASLPDLWRQAAEIVDLAFANPPGRRKLNDRANELGQQGLASLQAIGYLGAALQADSALEDVYVIQVMSAKYAADVLSFEGPTYQQIITPAVCQYWQSMVNNQPFRFTAPRQARSEIEAALRATESERLKKVLRSVRLSLAVRPPTAAQEAFRWINS